MGRHIGYEGMGFSVTHMDSSSVIGGIELEEPSMTTYELHTDVSVFGDKREIWYSGCVLCLPGRVHFL